MNKRQEIENAQSRIEQLRKEIANCKHDWKNVIFDPETVKEPYGYKTVGQGSDVWTEPTGYHDVQKNRWSRECKTCGHKEYTYTQEAVKTDYQPKFT